MSELRYARVWYLIGAVLTLIVIVGCLVPPRDVPRMPIGDKMQHLIAYAGLALWFGGLLAPRRYAQLALALLALGGGIEIAQALMGLGRTAEWRDFYADAVGAALGLALSLAGLGRWPVWAEQWLRLR